MKSVGLWALIVFNVVLCSALLARVGRENTAVAQVARSSDYLVVPGQISGNSGAVIYILDMTNGYLGSMTYETTRNRFDMMNPIELNHLFDAVQAGTPPAKGGKPAGK